MVAAEAIKAAATRKQEPALTQDKETKVMEADLGLAIRGQEAEASTTGHHTHQGHQLPHFSHSLSSSRTQIIWHICKAGKMQWLPSQTQLYHGWVWYE